MAIIMICVACSVNDEMPKEIHVATACTQQLYIGSSILSFLVESCMSYIFISGSE